MLGLVFGVTVYAASTVWATFMAGLAIGSLVAGWLGDRVRNPLRWFGITEALIGATALATPSALAWLQRAYVAVNPSLPSSLAALTAARFIIAFGVLIIPTVLMGATLPLVLKASTFRTSGLSHQVGLLYGSNAFGAIVGTVAAGLYLIPGYGIRGTFLVAAALNLLVGLTALAMSRMGAPHGDPGRQSAASVIAPSRETFGARILTEGPLLVVLGVFALSGVVSLALEVVWFRVLNLFLRPTVYGFSVMLATILAGISIGSYVATPMMNRRGKPMATLACLELAIGIAIVLSFLPLGYLPFLTVRLEPLLTPIMPDYLVYPIAGSLIAIFPAALLMGVAFPIGLQLWASAGPEAGGHTAARVGQFYAFNVAGAIAGSLAAGFLLLPRLGSRSSLILLGGLSLLSGLALLAVSEAAPRVRAAIAVAAIAAFAAAARISPDPFDQFVQQRYPTMRTVWSEEGVEATVVVHEFGLDQNARLVLTINGVHQAGTDAPTTFNHRRIGHLPMALHPTARTALVIGLGGGATAGAVSIHDGSQVDVVELANAVVDGARFFAGINYGVLSRPNVRLNVDDGRNYMMLTTRRYDVITADVIQPIYAGSGNLYSVEYFTLMRRVLNPGGLVLQWVPGTDAEYKTITRTFLSVFPETTAWADGSLLVGSVEPLRLRESDFAWKLQVPGRAQALRDLGIETFERLLATYRAGPDELRAFVGGGPVLTDDRPLAEYFLSLPRDRELDLAGLKGDVSRYVVPD